MERRKALLEGKRRIGIWGVGHIGYSTMSHFAEEGVRCIGCDIDPVKVARINRGESPIFAMDYWLGFDVRPLYVNGVARATTDWEEMTEPDISVHFVCIPTERSGEPDFGPLKEICHKIAAAARRPRPEPPLVIIESTLTPRTTDQCVIPLFTAEGLVVGQDILLGCTPRRDWFSSPDKSVRTLARIFGGTDAATSRAMRDVLSIVCQNLVEAPSHFHAEVVKSIENAYRHMEIGLAFELSRAYPSLDMRAVLELVGTKWNVGTFHPSFGVGGYCIPLSSHYVLQGAERPEELTLLKQTVKTCTAQPLLVAASLVQRQVKRVGILGLSYTENIKVSTLSPTIAIASYLAEAGVEVRVHDPHYSVQEIHAATGCRSFVFPEGLEEFDAVLVVAGHREYRQADHQRILRHMSNCRVVLDSPGLWREVDFPTRNIEYHVAGDMGWLNHNGSMPTGAMVVNGPVAQGVR